jgi:Rps23 Pro-64 3,4-dihydroxylase Tpa1-like proline 4-hydroxylase
MQSQIASQTNSQSTDQITVTLLLAGGQQYTVTISPEDSLLQELYEALIEGDANPSKQLFQIPIKQGRAVLAFPSERLIGLITEPPLIIEDPPAAVHHSDPLNSEYLQIDHFLTSEEHQQLLDYVIAQADQFVPTSTFTGEQNYRESVVLYSFPEYEKLLTQRIRAVLPDVLEQFGISPFQASQIEAQLTAHNDGNYYKVHNDNGSPDTASRELTYVYYFHREPKPFSGGELVIYDSKIQNNYYVQADTFKQVEPRNNSIVFFLSRYMHEVRPIHCPSRRFADSRFTVNGWVRRA